MSNETDPTHQPFRAEVQQLLDIVINSLYTDKEIFVRELVSNAADALEKFRHLRLTESELAGDDSELAITIECDEEAGTVSFIDTGIGMTRDELVENLGTIAHSGTRAFVQALQDGAEAKSNAIGQFGVGFYSAFMVADEVEVITRSWKPGAESLSWKSDGRSGFEIVPGPDGQGRGSRVVVHLKDAHKEFAKLAVLRRTLENYSNFVPFPIMVGGERANKIEAVWLKNKKDVSDEDYDEFYKFTAHAFDGPRMRMHFSADAPLVINALLFVPMENPEKFAMGQTEPGVSLYCRKVLIDDRPKGLLPDWLRFLRGVIDSEDLPLNISRESMQDSALVQKLNRLITKRFLKELESLAADDPDGYDAFYKQFSRFLKEGIATDFTHRDQIAKLLRFESSFSTADKTTSLDDYLSRAKDGQGEIYYQIAPNRAAIENGPYLEAFRARGLEVLYLLEPIDEYVVGSLGEFGGKKLVAAESTEAKLGDVEPEKPAGDEGEPMDAVSVEKLCTWLKDELGEAVTAVRASKRLVGSPAAALTTPDALSPQMRQMMKALNPEAVPEAAKVELEINPRHPLVRDLAAAAEAKPEMAKLVAAQVLDNALMAAGLLEDPKDMVQRLYRILGEAVK